MKKPAHITHVNGVETSAITITDRGLAYGDGLFETMRVVGGQVPLLKWHLKRFLRGVEILFLGDKKRMERDFLNYLGIAIDEIKSNACLGTCIVKMMVTRGSGGRGYVPPQEAQCHFIVQVFDMPEYPLTWYTNGIELRQCHYRLGFQPLLAGIKHLNRLDQVLASQELLREPEGLLLDYDDNVIEGTKSNLLVFSKKKILTPKLDACGVQGVMRDALISLADKLNTSIVEQDIPFSELEGADGLAMVNSVFGIWPVNTLIYTDGHNKCYKKHSHVLPMQSLLKQEFGYPIH